MRREKEQTRHFGKMVFRLRDLPFCFGCATTKVRSIAVESVAGVAGEVAVESVAGAAGEVAVEFARKEVFTAFLS